MKIAWAVDVFGANKEKDTRTAKFLSLFTSKASDLTAVYVASKYQPNLYTAFDIPEDERFGAYPLSLLKNVTRDAGLSLPPRSHVVGFSNAIAITPMTDHLCQAVKSFGPDLIATQTNQKKGMNRALLGSFTETLIHRSPRSLLVFNPSHPLPTKINRILFADDLTSVSSKARKFVCRLAHHFGAQVSVIHVDYVYRIGKKFNAPDIEAYRRRVDRALLRTRSSFVRKGVDVRAYIDGSSPDVADVIVRAAKRDSADLIVVSANTGPLRALLGGSTTRKVVRSSTVPVIVYK